MTVATIPCPDCPEDLKNHALLCKNGLNCDYRHKGHKGAVDVELTEEIERDPMAWHSDDMLGATRRWVSEREPL